MTTTDLDRSLQDDGPEDSVAFVVVRNDGKIQIIDLGVGTPISIGAAAEDRIRVIGDGILPNHLALSWNGESVTAEPNAAGISHRNGKPLEGAMLLEPGDELAVGATQLVVGVSTPLAAGGRRTLTHHEFRERFYEEVARASRAR